MAEWLRRLTRNQMGSSRVGSNPTRSDIIVTCHETKVSLQRRAEILNVTYFLGVFMLCHVVKRKRIIEQAINHCVNFRAHQKTAVN